jgi:acyl carrier protein
VSDVYDRLVDLLVNRFEVDRGAVGPDVSFEDLDVDSLFLVELLLVVQSEFAATGAEISEDLVAPSDTIGHAAELIERQITAAASA